MGNKHKKSNLRKITVNGKLYHWKVDIVPWQGKFLTIWVDRHKSICEGIDNEIITPKNVREIIIKKEL